MKSLEEVLKENKMKIRKEKIEEMRKKEIEQKKDTLIFLLVAGTIITLTILLLINMNNRQMNNCIKAGHSQNYCERGL